MLVAFNDFIGHLRHVEELKREEGTQIEINELEFLMRGHHIGRNSPGNLRISGFSKGRISKTLIYGENIKRLLIWKLGR